MLRRFLLLLLLLLCCVERERTPLFSRIMQKYECKIRNCEMRVHSRQQQQQQRQTANDDENGNGNAEHQMQHQQRLMHHNTNTWIGRIVNVALAI